MLTLLAFALILFPREEPRVTLKVPATSAATILATVGRDTGLKFELQPRFRDMPLVVSVRDVPLSDFLTNLAIALHVELQPTDDGYRLERPVRWQADMEAAKLSLAADQWAKTIARHQAQQAKYPWSPEQAVKSLKQLKDWFAGRRKGTGPAGPLPSDIEPSARLLTRLLSAIGASELAKLEGQDAVTFSSTPRGTDRPMPPGFADYLTDYGREAGMNPPKSPVPDHPSNLEVDSEVVATLNSIEGKVRRVELSIRGGTASLVMLGDSPGEMDQATITRFEPGNAVPTPPNLPTYDGLTPLKPSPLAMEMVQMASSDPDASNGNEDDVLDQGPSPDASFEPSRELLDLLLNPETHDPLSVLSSDVILHYADERHLNVIVELEDGDADPTAFELDENGLYDPTACLDWMLDGEPNLVTNPDWLVLHPTDLLSGEANHIPRVALGKYARASWKSGFSLATDVELATSLSPEQQRQVDLLSLPVEGLLQLVFGEHQWPSINACNFIGSLTPIQRTALNGGQSLRIATLTADQRQRLTRWVFDPSDSMISTLNDGGGGSPSRPESMGDVLPVGLPNDAWVKFATIRKPGFYGDGSMVSAREVAIQYLGSQATGLPAGYEGWFDRKYSPSLTRVTSVSHHFAIVLPNGLRMEPTFSYVERINGATPIPFPKVLELPEVKQWVTKYRGLSAADLMELEADGDD